MSQAYVTSEWNFAGYLLDISRNWYNVMKYDAISLNQGADLQNKSQDFPTFISSST